MNERTNLPEFLRSLPQGTFIYSPLYGYVRVQEVNASGIVVALPEGHDPELPDTLLFRDTGRLANHEYDGDEYQLFPSHICRDWSFLNFVENDVMVMEFGYKDGLVVNYITLYDGVKVSGEWYVKVKYAAYGAYDKLYDFKTISFQPVHWDELSLSFRGATEEEAQHLLSVLKKCTDDVKAQAQVVAYLQTLNAAKRWSWPCPHREKANM